MRIEYLTFLKKKPVSQAVLNKIIKQLAKDSRLKNKKLTLIIVGKQRIRTLNKKFRQQDKVTDVLSFSQREGLEFNNTERDYLGEIFICWPQVISQAKKFKHSAVKEFSILFVHGVLHLLGYDHEKEKDYQKMKSLEEKIISKLYV